MGKLSKWVFGAVVIVSVFSFGMVNFASANEWDDISFIEGRFSRIYFDYLVSGNKGTFYCINDWMVNQDDEGVDGGLLSNEYNRFNFEVGIDSYEIRIYPTGQGKVYRNSVLCGDMNDPNDTNECDSLPGLKSACCWTTSPSMPTIRHTIWEFSFEIQETMLVFIGCDPPGPNVVVNPNPPETPSIVSSGPSASPHVIDGRFTDDSAECELPPVPTRSNQAPSRDPFFDEHDGGAGWTFEFNTINGGVIIATASPTPARDDDIKWSQPPVEVNVGIINGWDEVSIIDSNGNCWDCPTQCHGDADCNGYVDQADSDILFAAYGTSQGSPNYNPCADFDRDGDVDTSDVTIMNSWWHTYPPANCPSSRAIVADDWICMDDRPITDIHWWGSFKGWTGCVPPADKPTAFHIGIWTDVPDPNKSNPSDFSHPGKLIWEEVCSCYTWSYDGYDVDPRHIEANEACFKFDQFLSQDKWFYQDSNDSNGTVYWLSIAAIYDACEPEPNHPWGWKTRPRLYNDDAVRITDINDGTWPPTIGKSWASGERVGTPWDTAFVLTTNRKYMPKPGYWPDDNAQPVFPPGPGPNPGPPIPWPSKAKVDFNSDLRIDFEDFAVLAGYWLTEGEVWPEVDLP